MIERPICPKCGGKEIRRDAEVRWDDKINAWALMEDDWMMGSFCWCAECETEFYPEEARTSK